MEGGRHRPAWRFLPPLHPIVAEVAPLTLTTEPVGVLEPPTMPGRVLVTASKARLAGRVKGIVAAAPIAHDLVDLPLRRAVARHGEALSVEDAFETVEVAPAGPASELPEVVTPADLVAPRDVVEQAPPVVHVRRDAPSSAPLLTVAQVRPPQVAETPSTPSRFMHITYREQDQQLAEWYAEENQAEQPAPNVRPADVVAEPVEADAFEPMVQEREFTLPEPGIKRRGGPRPAVMRRASLAESRRQGLGIKRKPAQATGGVEPVIIDAPMAAELPAAQAVPGRDGPDTLEGPETTVEETAPSPPLPPSSPPAAVVAEDAVAVREVRAAEPERLIAPSTTAPSTAPPTAPPDVSVDRPLETPVEPDLPLRQAGSPQVRPETTSATDPMLEVAHRETKPRESAAPEAARREQVPRQPSTEAARRAGLAPEAVAVPEVVHRETAPHEPVRPELPLREAAARQEARRPNDPAATGREPVPNDETERPELPLLDKRSRREKVRDEPGPQGTTKDVSAPREVTPSEPVRHRPAQPEPVARETARLENATHEPTPRPDSPQEMVDGQAIPAAEQTEPGEAQPLVLRNPTPPHATASKVSTSSKPPVAPVHSTSAVSPPVPELELSSTPQLAPVGLGVVGHMISSAIEERVPPALIGPLRRALAIEPAHVPIRRGEAVSATAERLGARAFTADGAVYLPDDAGSVDSTDTAPLLAHELTHAAQQEHFGVTMPGLETATGQHLESEAVAMEEWVKDGAVGPPPVRYGYAEPEQFAESDSDSDMVERAQAAPRLSVISGRRTPTSTELALERFRQSRPDAPAPSTTLLDASPTALVDRVRRQNPNLPPPSTALPVATPAALLDQMRRKNPNLPPPGTDRPNATPAGLLDRMRRPNPALPVAAPAALLDRMRRPNPNLPAPSTDLPLATPAALLDRMRRQSAAGPQAGTATAAAAAAMITAMDQITASVSSVPSGPPPGPGPGFPPIEPPDEPPEDLVTYGPERPPPGWSPGGDFEEPTPSSVVTAPPDLAEFVKEVRDNPPRRWLDLDDPDHFDEISHRVYNTLQARLRFDVLLERERNGTLMDFS